MRKYLPILRRRPSLTIEIQARNDADAWAELTFLIKCSEKYGTTSRDLYVRKPTP